MTNYKPTSSIHNYDRELPEGIIDYKVKSPYPSPEPKNPRDDKKTLLDKILGIFK